MRKRSIDVRFLAALGVIVLILAALPVVMTQGLMAQDTNPEDKIEAALLNQLTAQGRADFMVVFSQQANLSRAYRMSWKERGEYVYDTLTKVAQTSQARAKGLLDSRGLSYRTFIAGNELYVWAGGLDAVNTLAQLPEVASILATRTYYVGPLPSPEEQVATAPQQTVAWGITNTGADQFWSQFGVQGDGIVVAGIDTGVQWNHPALDQSFKCGVNPADPACWSDPSNVCGGSACDNNGHGTHTMGTMVADDDPTLTYIAGMAPNAQWIACKGCESGSCSSFALNGCADWVLAPGGNPANRPHVVNNSWGGGGCDTWYLSKVNAWRAAGIFPAFSAGNDGPGCSTLGSPGAYQESFSSAAHSVAGGIASFSSRGPNLGACHPYTPYTKPNISAPGVDVCSTVPGNGWDCTYDGTSMASPHTAGAVALLWSCNPALVGQIDLTFQYLQNTARAAGPGSCGAPPTGQGDYTFGYGYLDIYQAGLQHCFVGTPTPTPSPTITPTPLPPVTPIAWVNLPLAPKQHAGPTRTPLPVTATPTPSAGWQTIIWEDFEGAFPGPWQVFDNLPGYGEYFWGKRTCRPYAGGYSGWGVGGGANGSALSCGSNYPNDTEGWMLYGPFSLADATAAEMRFMLWLNTENTYDRVCRLYSTDGFNFDGFCTSGNSSGWIDRVLDMGAAVGQPNVWVALVFDSDFSINYPEGGYVDNLIARKCVGGSCPPAAGAPWLPGGVNEWPVSIQRPQPGQ